MEILETKEIRLKSAVLSFGDTHIPVNALSREIIIELRIDGTVTASAFDDDLYIELGKISISEAQKAEIERFTIEEVGDLSYPNDHASIWVMVFEPKKFNQTNSSTEIDIVECLKAYFKERNIE